MVRLPFTIDSLVKLRRKGSTTNRLLLLGFAGFAVLSLHTIMQTAKLAREEQGEELLKSIRQVGGTDQETINRLAEIMHIKVESKP
jgi:hypothetical protein